MARSASAGLTDSAFSRVSSSTLRYWLDWWSDPSRSPEGAEEDGRNPATEAARVRSSNHGLRVGEQLEVVERDKQRRRARLAERELGLEEVLR